jgi:hypothetical protein
VKITSKSSGTPPPASAAAFARLLLAAVERKPELKIVPKGEKAKAA